MTAVQADVAPSPAAAKAVAGEERFLLLDGLRGIAAFAVILDHTPSNFLGDLIPGRYLAVDFFFVLSGFVLAHAYGKRLEGGWSVFSFMRARIIRLYPLYLVGLVLGVTGVVLGILRGWQPTPLGEVWVYAMFGLFFLPAPPIYALGGGHLYPFNGPAWSLFFELLVNLIYGFIARFLNRWVLGLILAVGAVGLVFTLSRNPGVGGPGWLWGHFDAGLARVVFGFFAGVALFRLRGVWRVDGIPRLLAVVLPILMFIAVIAFRAPAEWRALYDASVAIVVMPAIVWFASQASIGEGFGRLATWLGAVSYGVYVLHVPLLQLLFQAETAANVMLPGWVTVVVIVILAGGLAAFLHHAYDTPVRRWLSRTLPGRASR